MKNKRLNLAEVKAKLSHLVDQAARGKSIVIAKAGLPVAKLAPLEITKPKKIKFGVLAGTLILASRLSQPLKGRSIKRPSI